MNLEPSTMLSVGAGFAAVVSSWAVFGYRLRQVETAAAEAKTERAELRKAVDQVVATLETVRTSQGKRLGDVEDDTAILKGKFQGFEAGFGAGRRSRTAAGGHPVAPSAAGSSQP